jgi:hypothetical protein
MQNNPSMVEVAIARIRGNMVDVWGGTFRMGASEQDPDALPGEKPSHEATVGDYRICFTRSRRVGGRR